MWLWLLCRVGLRLAASVICSKAVEVLTHAMNVIALFCWIVSERSCCGRMSIVLMVLELFSASVVGAAATETGAPLLPAVIAKESFSSASDPSQERLILNAPPVN